MLMSMNGEYYEHCYRSDIGDIMNGDWEQDIGLKPNGYKDTEVYPGVFQGPGRGTTGVFLETNKHIRSARMPIVFP